VYLNTSGLYYVNAANDVITPLASTYGLHLGVDYDLWAANRTGSQPSAPVVTLGVPCVATQYMSYAQTGAQYDVNIAFDTSWTAAFGGTAPALFIASEVDTTVDPVESLTGGTATGSGGGTPAPPVNWPQLSVQIALQSATPVAKLGTFILNDSVYGQLDSGRLGDTNNWTDITAYVRSGTITRASSRTEGPLLQYQPATLSVALNNGDSRFDQDNASSPYAGSIRPMIPVRVTATWQGTTYPLFYGYADGWTDDGINYAGRYAQTTLAATDGFKVLGGIYLAALGNAVGANDDTGQRINRILTAAQWYTGQRKVSAGDSDLQSTTYGDYALNLMQTAADSEIGELYHDAAGYIVFRHRHAILTDTRSLVPQAVFGDSPGLAHGGNFLQSPDTDFAGPSQGNWTGAGNSTITSTTISGTTCLQITSAASGAMQAASCTAASITTKGMPVATGYQVTVSAEFETASSARACAAGAQFYDSAGTQVGAAIYVTPVTDNTSAFTTCTGTVTAPAGAAYARLIVQVRATAAASEVHYMTAASIAPASLPASLPELAYASVVRPDDDTMLANDIQATSVNGTLQEVTDATSIAQSLFPRTYQRTDLLLTTDAETLNWAQWVLAVSKDTEDRFDSLVLNPLRDPQDLWPQALGRDIGDRIQVWRRPPGGSVVARDEFVRGMQHDFDASAQSWQTQFTLQDATRYTGFLILDAVPQGQLDSGKLAY
jgi:hypothetical protein